MLAGDVFKQWTDFQHAEALLAGHSIADNQGFTGTLDPHCDLLDLYDQHLTCDTLINGLPQGYCRLSYVKDSSYCGNLKDGRRHGIGILKCANETEVNAEWCQDQICGFFVIQTSLFTCIGDSIEQSQKVIPNERQA